MCMYDMIKFYYDKTNNIISALYILRSCDKGRCMEYIGGYNAGVCNKMPIIWGSGIVSMCMI